ncbi:MAG: LacI family DNA-binding transcriptional regulator [Thermotogota bacterium]
MKNNKATTIKDVAKKANTGIATVSRVINNSGRVSEKTKARILKAIDELGYSPNLHARSLSSKKGNSISLVVPDMGEFYGILYKNMEKKLSEIGYRLIVFPLVDEISLAKIKNKTDLIYQTDAVFISSLSVKKIFEDKIPQKKLILIDSKDERFDSIYIDNYEIGVKAAEYLLNKSKSRDKFLIISFKELENDFTSHVFKQRDQGFLDTLKRYNKRCKRIYADLYWNGGYEAMKKYVKKTDITKSKVHIFSTCDMLGFGVRNFFNENRLKPNINYNLIAVDDLPISEVIGLTTVQQPLKTLAEKSVSTFKSFLKNKDKKITHKKVDPKVIIRKT